MFTEWTDPYDIDQYYNEVGALYSKVNAYTNKALEQERQLQVRNIDQRTAERESFQNENRLPDDHPLQIPMVYTKPTQSEQQKDFALRTDPTAVPHHRDEFSHPYRRGGYAQNVCVQNPRIVALDIDVTYLLMLIIIGMMFVHIMRLYSSLEMTQRMISDLTFNIHATSHKSRNA